MNKYDLSKRVEAIGYTQKAIDAISALHLKANGIDDMLRTLEDTRTELAYQIFRSNTDEL